MKATFFSVIVFLSLFTLAGCRSQNTDAPDNVIIDGKVLYGKDMSPLWQAVVKRVSDGKVLLTDTLGNFHIEAHAGDSLRFSFVGTIDRTMPVSRKDTHMTVELEPYIPGNDEYTYNENLFGVYKNGDDGSTMRITQAEEGKYTVSINIIRLTGIDDCIGKLKDGRLIFTGTDAAGNPISGEITVKGNSAKLVFTNSTWEYLPDGTTFTFERET